MKPSKRQDAPQGAEREGGAEEARRQRLEKERQILSPEPRAAENASYEPDQDAPTA